MEMPLPRHAGRLLSVDRQIRPRPCKPYGAVWQALPPADHQVPSSEQLVVEIRERRPLHRWREIGEREVAAEDQIEPLHRPLAPQVLAREADTAPELGLD